MSAKSNCFRFMKTRWKEGIAHGMKLLPMYVMDGQFNCQGVWEESCWSALKAQRRSREWPTHKSLTFLGVTQIGSFWKIIIVDVFIPWGSLSLMYIIKVLMAAGSNLVVCFYIPCKQTIPSEIISLCFTEPTDGISMLALNWAIFV